MQLIKDKSKHVEQFRLRFHADIEVECTDPGDEKINKKATWIARYGSLTATSTWRPGAIQGLIKEIYQQQLESKSLDNLTFLDDTADGYTMSNYPKIHVT